MRPFLMPTWILLGTHFFQNLQKASAEKLKTWDTGSFDPSKRLVEIL